MCGIDLNILLSSLLPYDLFLQCLIDCMLMGIIFHIVQAHRWNDQIIHVLAGKHDIIHLSVIP